MSLRSSAALVGLLTACTASPPPAATNSEPAVDPPAPTKPDPAPPVEPTPVPVDPAPVAPPLPSAPEGAEFQLAAWRDGDLSVHVLGDRVFVLGALDVAHLDEGGTRLVRPEYGFTGLADPLPAENWRVHAFGGTWPDDAWLVIQQEMSRSSHPTQVYRRDGERWHKLDNKDDLLFWYYAAIVPWQGKHLGVRLVEVDPSIDEFHFSDTPSRKMRKAQRMASSTRPRFDVLAATPTPALPVFADGLAPLTAAAAPTGELFVLGRRTTGKLERPVVQRFAPAGDAALRGPVDALPHDGACEHLAVRAGDEAYVACRQHNPEQKPNALLRFDGTTWSSEPTPDDAEVAQLTVAPDGTQWIITDSIRADHSFPFHTLHRRAPGGAWERITLPELRFPDRAVPEWLWPWEGGEYVLDPPDPAAAARSHPVSPIQVLARAGGEVWIAGNVEIDREGPSGYGARRHVVLRNAKLREPLRMLHDADLELEIRDWKPAPEWMPGEGCPDDRPAFATLHTLPRDAPRDAPDPLVEALVRDQRAAVDRAEAIVEAWHRGRRTVGLIIKLTEKSDVEQLLAALTRVAPDDPHPLQCRRPRLRRSFDKTTGRPLEATAW